jgi:lipoprotein-anchoring transpeptidase ErfK/SrfK
MSMGCIRLLPDDIALLYKLLSTGHSTVRVEP